MERFLIGADSEILVGEDLLQGEVLPEREGRGHVAVLTQPGASRHADGLAARLAAAGLSAHTRVLPDGDAAKTLAVVEASYRWLNDVGFDRTATIVGVGGGSVTDVSGFIAATYLRGIEAVYVPTTLLGAVDAAVGGKTGVNLDGKNLVGAFRHPRRVVVDTALLADLPEELWIEGAAEALKTGMIADPELVDLFTDHGRQAPVGDIVRRSLAVKVRVVQEDFEERGARAILNYGHTIGHAVEVACGLSHGAAVAVGMVAAGVASQRLVGFAGAEAQKSLVASLGMPTTAAGADSDATRRLLELDKKRDAAGLRMVLLADVGDPMLRHVDSATVDAALAAVAAPD